MQLLDIRNLTLELETPDGLVRAVDRVNLSLREGEIRGLVGESESTGPRLPFLQPPL